MLSLLLQEETGVTKSGLKIDIRFCDNRAKLLFFKKGTLWQLSMVQFKSVNATESFQGDSLLLTTESLGVPGTLLINLTMKTPTGFKSGDTGLVIGNCLIDSLHFHYNKAMYKIFKI